MSSSEWGKDVRVVRAKLVKWLAVALGLSAPGPLLAQQLSFFGNSGLIETPNATVLDDGDFGISVQTFGNTLRYGVTFQLTPRIQISARYAIIRNVNPPTVKFDGDHFDRSFDAHFLLVEETERRPSVAIGLRDFVGTGIYGGEYIVVSKSLGPKVRVSGGIGWGRFGQRNGFENPLAIFSDGFKTREQNQDEGGTFSTGAWFQGDAAFFGGVEWQVTDRLKLLAEYSPDLTTFESQNNAFENNSPINLGLSYSFPSGANINVAYLYGSAIGVSLSYTFNPKNPRAPGGQEEAPPSFLPRNAVAAQSWNLVPASARPQQAQGAVSTLLKQQGITLVSYEESGGVARVRIENDRYLQRAQAAGRTARILANTAHPDVKAFEVVFIDRGVPQSSVRLNRSDVVGLEFDLEGSWHSFARAQVADAFDAGIGTPLPGIYPRFEYTVAPYASFSLFDPNSPVRYDIGVRASASYELRPGLVFSGDVRYPFVSTVEETPFDSNSVLPRVRTDGPVYAQQADLEITYLTAEYFFRPRSDVFGRVTVGYLEKMFGGVSAEVLWYPIDSRLALGAEINYVRQRNFNQLFGFQDYGVLTGHASAYYDLGRGFRGQVDVGRYLAGDWGATFTLEREFKNGFAVGGFFTLTDVPFDEFGEGSFDKGIRLTIPTSWLSGQPSRTAETTVVRPIQRDGGARLDVRNRLHKITRPYRARKLSDGWGKFYR